MRADTLPVDLHDERSFTVPVSHYDGLDRLTVGHDLPVHHTSRNNDEVSRFSGCRLYGFVTMLNGERIRQHVEHCRVGSMMMPTGGGTGWDG